MQKIQQALGKEQFVAVVVLAATVLFSVGFLVVSADTTSTSVTVGNAAPTIDSISFNAGNNITLNEDDGSSGGFVYASTTITITDTNGCSDITSVTAKAYRAATTSAGTTCTADDNNCYLEFSACAATTTGNQCSGGSDTTVEYDCSFRLWYTADPTATNEEGFGSNIWVLAATTTDGTDTVSATNTGELIEVNTLLAHRVDASLAFGSVAAGSNTGNTNSTTTVTVSGNAALDTDVSCDVMCTDYSDCDGSFFGEDQMEHALAPFTDGSGTTCAATTSPATIETVLAKPTATTSSVTDDISWSIAIPSGQAAGSYTGQNTLDASAD